MNIKETPHNKRKDRLSTERYSPMYSEEIN